ncbi:MAG: 4Fe-4S dicluster domain-containing protein [Candidatus Edwardsbacteria bacterium]|nr:4Fe-4S dicluster domain-containing protein [Candidatus Edwardsbacteria bacterium]
MPEKKLYSLPKAKVPGLIASLLKSKHEVWGPVRGENDDVYLNAISSGNELTGDYVNGFLGAKRYVFPQLEEMFRFKKGRDGMTLTPAEPPKKTVIWGLRSCDMSAVLYFDSFFGRGAVSGPDWKSGDPLPDPLYLARREAAVFVTVACNAAGPKCFCVCTDSGPFMSKGYDVQLSDLGTHYLAETGTPRGEEFIHEHRAHFAASRNENMKKRRRLEVEAEKTFLEPVSFFAKAMRKLDKGSVKPEFWNKVAGYCVGCGGCIYVCPMCSCFDVDDAMLSPNEGVRFRSWDTCDFAGFTREVMGHNPRAARADRRKRWFYHKLSMDYLEKNPVIGCVGCGRCVTACPGEVDMATVARWMRKAE